MRAQAMMVLLLLAGCDSFKNVPCGQCEKYGAVCDTTTNTCRLGPLDMAVTVENDMAKGRVVDLSTEDGPTPPMCTPATVTSDCVDATKPVCGSDGNCRACNSVADDPVCKLQSSATPHCQLAGANAGTCVQCTAATQATDCGGIAPICGSDGTCRKCNAHSECPALGMWPDGTAIPGICIFDGVNPGGCADPGAVAYVDNRAMSVTGCNTGHTYDGTTPANAYCDIQDAVIAVGGKAFVVVRGRGATNDYGDPGRGGVAVNVTRAVTLIGPGGEATTAALISSNNSGSPCITVSGAGVAVVDGFEIGDANGGFGVSCTGTSFVGRRNYIHTATSGGVTATGCDMTLDGNFIDSNNGGGVTINNPSRYSLTNNIISSNGNGTVGYGVQISSTNLTNSVFAFNTVVNNMSAAAFAPGIQCNAAGITIQDSIVVLNTPLLSGSQMSAACSLMNVVTGPDTATGANMAVPVLTTSYKLDISSMQNEAKNKTCCIDKLATPNTPFSDHDVDFTARPKGTGATPYDIGANEAE